MMYLDVCGICFNDKKQTYRPSTRWEGSWKTISVFSEMVILGEKHAVLELKHIQLAINGKVVTSEHSRRLKAPIVTPIFRAQP